MQHFDKDIRPGNFKEANDLFSQGNYKAALINMSRFLKNIPRRETGFFSRWDYFCASSE